MPDRDERWQVKKLSAKYRRIAYLLAAGHTQTKVAKELEMSITHVNRIANSPLIAEEVRRIQDEIGLAILKKRFRQLLEGGHGDSLNV